MARAPQLRVRLAAIALALVAPAFTAPDADAQTAAVRNTAAATYETIAGTDSVGSDTAETTLVFPELFLQKLLDGPTTARIGEEVRYTLRYGNASSTVEARDAVLSDTLPTGLEFVSSQPSAQVADRVLSWSLGDVAPGDTALIELTVRVSDEVRDTLRVNNRAVLGALNSSAQVAVAAEVELIGLTADQLALDKAADVLEVGIGETVPYTLTLENTGLVPLTGMVVHDRLPSGVRFSRGSALGADSVHVADRDLTLFVAGPLGPGRTHTVRYQTAVVSGENQVLANTAFATAENRLVRSGEVTAFVRLRSNWPMETRAVIGKVWVDLNDDGGQDPGEPGVEGVDIWTDDGDVATSDREGKFSLRNVRPGRHAFRLDPSSLPLRYRVAGNGSAEDLEVVDADGWTTPRVNFRLIPRGAALAGVKLPVTWRFTARPLCSGLDEAIPSARGERATLARFRTNSAELGDGSVFMDQLARTLAERRECRIEIAGHADPRSVHGGPFRDNWELSVARASAVARKLGELAPELPPLAVRGFGASRPVAPGRDPYSLWLNRRVELQLAGPTSRPSRAPVVEYELVLENDYGVPLRGFAVRFHPVPDSAVAELGDSISVRLSGHPLPLPEIPPHTRLRVKGWSTSRADSAAAVLETRQRSSAWLFAAVHNYVMPARGVASASAVADSLPSPTSLPPGGSVDIDIEPVAAGWPEVTYAVPDGWEPVKGSVRVGGLPAEDPEIRRDRSGEPVLHWRFRGRARETITLALRPSGSVGTVETVRIDPLRSPEERAAEKRRSITGGPGVEIFAPSDGRVYRSDRAWVGVRGEPGAPVALFDGDSLIAEGHLRIDGIHDFIGVGLPRGPHRLRVRMNNSWNQERWDSVAVHVTGLPALLEPEQPILRMRADGHATEEVRVRVRDRWGVPVVNPVYVTVSAEGAEPLGRDADPSSVGLQLRTDPAGWLGVTLRPGHEVGRGVLTLKAGETTREVPLEILAAARPLMITGVGRVGLGASPDAFGAVTARGRIDDRTAVTFTYDSRRLDAGRDIFARDHDPLEQAQYPILGDASQRRTVSASEYAFSARIERGFDWLALGDISTTDFTAGLTLAAYRRSLPGAAARITTGPVLWKGFGSSTTQSLRQVQLRGAGSSGPYTLDADIRPGTEGVMLETRARENAQRILSQQRLVRFVDYQIDYERGTLLFKRPVPAADPFENPIFIMVTYEAESGGPRRETWGVRAALGADGLVESEFLDSLRVGATWIRDGQADGDHHLVGGDLRLLRYGGLDIGAEVTYSQSPDSSDFATAVDGSLQLFDDALNLSAGWMKIGDEFRNPSNIALRGGTEEVRVGGGLRIGPSELRVEHERQSFETRGVERERTTGGIVQSLGSRLEIDMGVAQDRFETAGGTDESRAGEVTITWKPTSNLRLWTDGRREFDGNGNVVRPDYVGGGAAFQVSRALSLETQHRQVLLPDSTDYSVTSLGVRTNLGLGTRAYGSYQIAGGVSGEHNAAVIGLNNRLHLGNAWSINAMFERRFGIDRASVADPVRSLPFLQQEEDYWAAGLGLELLPPEAPYRLSARGEYRDGDFQSNRLVTLAGDVSIDRSLALLTRNEFLQTERQLAAGTDLSRRRSTLWGLAFRPVGGDALNVLTKFEWIDETNPMGGGVLTREGDEERMIAATEAIWSPVPWTELAGRYALRRTEAERLHEDGVLQGLTSWADYVGGRLKLDVARWLALRGEGRLLIERTSDSRRWDAAPSLVLLPIEGIEVAGGYRFGDLSDPDFAVRGGHGWFVVFGARLTESVFPTAADFWRSRF